MREKLTIQDVSNRIQETFSGKIKVISKEIKNPYTKLTFKCKIHGIFNRHYYNTIYSKCGCPKCGNKLIGSTKKLTTKEFIRKANKIHNNFYIYNKVIYKNTSTKVIITCPIHGDFNQTPNSHLNGTKCRKCAYIKIANKNNHTTELFIKKANITHNNRYNYSKTLYDKSNKKVIIICPVHGQFLQTPSSHLHGTGCPHCRKSKGENSIYQFLKKNNIEFITQKTLKRKKQKPLYFDFFLPKYNMYIEYQGEQHYEIVEHWGGKQNFIKSQKRDRIKRNWCKQNKYILLEIPYTQLDYIDNILKSELNI